MGSSKADLSPNDEVCETRITVKPIHKRCVRKIGRLDCKGCRHRDWIRQNRRGQHSGRQHNTRQNASDHRSYTREIVGWAKFTAIGRFYKRPQLGVETRESERSSGGTGSQPERSGRAAGVREANKRLIVK